MAKIINTQAEMKGGTVIRWGVYLGRLENNTAEVGLQLGIYDGVFSEGLNSAIADLMDGVLALFIVIAKYGYDLPSHFICERDRMTDLKRWQYSIMADLVRTNAIL